MDWFSMSIDLGESGIVFSSTTFLHHIQYFKNLLGEEVIDYDLFLKKYKGNVYNPAMFHLRFIEFLRKEKEINALKTIFNEKKTVLYGYFRDDYKILKYSLTVELEYTEDLLSKQFSFSYKQKNNNTEVSCIKEDYVKLSIGG